jgi:hypothetical protein
LICYRINPDDRQQLFSYPQTRPLHLANSRQLLHISHIMNALTQPLAFASAYRQLQPSERAYVDAYVAAIEAQAVKNHERISNALHTPVSQDVIDASGGMMQRALVRAAITERITEIAAASELTQTKVIRAIMPLAFSSMADYMEIAGDGQPYFDFARCNPDQLAAIQSIEIEEDMRGKRKFKFKLHDKLKAIDMLMSYMGLKDADNPHWRSDSAKPVNAAAIPVSASDDAAAEIYSRMING